MWVTAPALHLPVQRCHCRVHALAALRHWQPVHLHLGAGDATARLALLEGDSLAAGDAMLAELILAMPLGALVHDRFILRDASANRTIGGGQVLDVFPPARRKRAPEHLALLRLCEDDDPAVALAAMLERQPAGVDLVRYAQGRNLPSVDALARDLGIHRIGNAGFTPCDWQALAGRLLAALAAEHERAADLVGVERDRLRRLTLPTLARDVFDALVGELLAAGRLAQTGGWLHLPDHRATLPGADVELWQRLLPLLDAAPFQPPRVRDVARATGLAEERVRGLMKRVARVGLAYPVAHDHYFTARAVAELAARVDGLCERDGAARAAALRDAVGGGRKVAVQILEFFDRVSYTRRVRDVHVRRDAGAARQWVLQ
jgi:selenocysteine-specific elongation factor